MKLRLDARARTKLILSEHVTPSVAQGDTEKKMLCKELPPPPQPQNGSPLPAVRACPPSCDLSPCTSFTQPRPHLGRQSSSNSRTSSCTPRSFLPPPSLLPASIFSSRLHLRPLSSVAAAFDATSHLHGSPRTTAPSRPNLFLVLHPHNQLQQQDHP